MNEKKNHLPASEAVEITDAMSILEAEPARDSEHREKLAFLVASGKTKEMIGAKQSEDLKDSSPRGAGLQPEPEPEPETSLSFSLTQILSVVCVVLSLAGLYYKRKEWPSRGAAGLEGTSIEEAEHRQKFHDEYLLSIFKNNV